MTKATWWTFLVAVWLLPSDPVRCCNTPVYQKAMETWEALPYLLFECRDGASDKQGKQGEEPGPVDPMTGRILKAGKGPTPNLDRFVLDLSRTDDTLRQQIEAVLGQKVEKLLPDGPGPRILILWPLAYSVEDGVFWSGPLKDLDLSCLTDSPARHELARQLLQKRVLVWLYVPSGEKADDEKYEGVLRESLKRMEQEVERPPVDGNPEPMQAAEVPANPKFGLLKFVTGKPEERGFERMLRIEKLWKEKKVPLAFAVCGRGRVLTVLAGEEITPDMVGQLCTFACGPCSCGANPGYDLLMTVDWKTGLEKEGDIEKALGQLPDPKAPATTPGASGADLKSPTEPAVPSPLENKSVER